jgi:hypothetical protein
MRPVFRSLSGLPVGQSLIELIILLGVMSLLLTTVVLVGFIGDSGIRTSLAARVAAFDCDRQPGFCRDGSLEPERRVRENYLLGKFRDYVQVPEDVGLSVDLPRVDGADKNLLGKLADALRGFSLKAGPLIFGLPSPDQLTRSTVQTVVWRSEARLPSQVRMPTIRQTSRLALISDSWSAGTSQHFAARVKAGEHPSGLLSGAASIAYFPAKDLLMPVMDAVGLEANTRAFRNAFHNTDPDVPYSNSRVRIR